MFEMSSSKNAEIKKQIMQAKNNGSYVFPQNLYVPFIDDEYEISEEKILFVGDVKKINAEPVYVKETKRSYPSRNLCSASIEKNDRFEECLKTKCVNQRGFAYYNFFFDRLSGTEITTPAPPVERLEVYLYAFATVFNALKPTKVVFWGNQILRVIKRASRPKAFNRKTVDEFLEQTNYELFRLNGKKNDVSAIPELEKCINDLEVVMKTLWKVLKGQNPGKNAFFKEQNSKDFADLNVAEFKKLNAGDIKVSPPKGGNVKILLKEDSPVREFKTQQDFLIFKSLRRISKAQDSCDLVKNLLGKNKNIEQEQYITYFSFMLNFLDYYDFYISRNLIETFIEFTKLKYHTANSMIINEDLGNDGIDVYEAHFEKYVDELREKHREACLKKEATGKIYLKKSQGYHKKLQYMFNYYCNHADQNTRELAEIMKNRIFIDNGPTIEGLVKKKTYDAFKKEKKINGKWQPKKLLDNSWT